MFIYNPHAPLSLRYAILNQEDPTGKAILRQARAAAREHIDRIKDSPARQRLHELMRPLDMGQLNHLACMYMISNNWQGATGQGGIWATASSVCNQVAGELLQERPAFEVMTDPGPDFVPEPFRLTVFPDYATAKQHKRQMF